MGVRKFRDVSEMEDTLWRVPGDPELLRAIASTWAFADRVLPATRPACAGGGRPRQAAK